MSLEIIDRTKKPCVVDIVCDIPEKKKKVNLPQKRKIGQDVGVEVTPDKKKRCAPLAKSGGRRSETKSKLKNKFKLKKKIKLQTILNHQAYIYDQLFRKF